MCSTLKLRKTFLKIGKSILENDTNVKIAICYFFEINLTLAEPLYSFFFFLDLSLNILLKYSYFRRRDLLLAVSEKIHTRKSCISSKIKHM